MSEVFDFTKEQMLYIYANKHTEHEVYGESCACNDQVDVALKLMIAAQGAIIYSTQNADDMQKCLEKLGVRLLHIPKAAEAPQSSHEKWELCESEHCVITQILTKETILKLRLVCADPALALHLQREGIELVEWCSFIAFDYGEGGV